MIKTIVLTFLIVTCGLVWLYTVLRLMMHVFGWLCDVPALKVNGIRPIYGFWLFKDEAGQLRRVPYDEDLQRWLTKVELGFYSVVFVGGSAIIAWLKFREWNL